MSPGRPGFPGMGYRQGDGSLIRIESHVSTGCSHRPANSVAFSDRLAETQDVRGSCRDAQPRHYKGWGLKPWPPFTTVQEAILDSRKREAEAEVRESKRFAVEGERAVRRSGVLGGAG